MDKRTFEQCLKTGNFPENGNIFLKALYFDAKGDWAAAHNIAQMKEGTQPYDRIHAYLHRKEGDMWNAQYWYRRAGATMPKGTLQEEWADLVEYFTEN